MKDNNNNRSSTGNWIALVSESGDYELTGKIVFKGPVVFESDVQFRGNVEFKQLPQN